MSDASNNDALDDISLDGPSWLDGDIQLDEHDSVTNDNSLNDKSIDSLNIQSIPEADNNNGIKITQHNANNTKVRVRKGIDSDRNKFVYDGKRDDNMDMSLFPEIAKDNEGEESTNVSSTADTRAAVSTISSNTVEDSYDYSSGTKKKRHGHKLLVAVIVVIAVAVALFVAHMILG